MEQQPPDNPAADFIAKITAELHAGAGEDEEAEPEPEAEPEGQDGPQALPDFLPVRADRDAALQEMHDAIANTLAEAWAGAEIRDELALEDEIARREVEERMLAELGMDTTEGLTDPQKRKLSREKTKAAKAAKAAVLERYGRIMNPDRASTCSMVCKVEARRRPSSASWRVDQLVPTLWLYRQQGKQRRSRRR